MTTKNIVPRANNEGGIGTSAKRWSNGYFTDINASGDVSVTGTITGDLTGNADTATNATNATNDSNGNKIDTTYMPIAGGTFTGDVNGVTPPAGDDSKKLANTEFIQALASILVPVGCVQAYAGNTLPNGWLLCDGSAVSRTDYAELYSVIGDTYGSGDGSTTFNLPDMSGRVAIGSGTGTDANSNTETFALGDSDGEYTHQLTKEEMPAHNHVFSNWYAVQGANGYPCGISGSPYGSTDMSMLNTGGDAYHNNIQPYTVLQYIIKY